MRGPTCQFRWNPSRSRGPNIGPQAIELHGHSDFHETCMGVGYAALHKAHIRLEELDVLRELMGDPYGRSAGRADVLVAAASPTFRIGYLALSE